MRIKQLDDCGKVNVVTPFFITTLADNFTFSIKGAQHGEECLLEGFNKLLFWLLMN